ncbi:DUF4190 domain-containing protein [Leucobacter sp. wl10]|nr:DUF4190 domain-containing protein [Leucobacter sp. wl10]
MIAGIIGILGWLFTSLFAIAAVIMGHISLSQIRARGDSGRGMAITGLVLGYIAIGFSLLAVIFWFFIWGGLAGLGAVSSTHS